MKSKLILKDNKLYKTTPVNIRTFEKDYDKIDTINFTSSIIDEDKELKTMIYYLLKNQEETNRNVSIITKIMVFSLIMNIVSIIISIVLASR